jgi:hypothetical protein
MVKERRIKRHFARPRSMDSAPVPDGVTLPAERFLPAVSFSWLPVSAEKQLKAMRC